MSSIATEAAEDDEDAAFPLVANIVFLSSGARGRKIRPSCNYY